MKTNEVVDITVPIIHTVMYLRISSPLRTTKAVSTADPGLISLCFKFI